LNRSSLSLELVDDISVPSVLFDQISDKMRVDADELSSQNSSSVEVGIVWLEALIVTKNL